MRFVRLASHIVRSFHKSRFVLQQETKQTNLEQITSALDTKSYFENGVFIEGKEQALRDVMLKYFPEDVDIILLATRKMSSFELNRDKIIEDYRQAHMDEGTRLEELIRTFGSDGALMSAATKLKHEGRRVASVDGISLLTLDDYSPEQLPIITGESGSGKTFFLLNGKQPGELPIYLVPHRDIAWNDSDWNCEGQEPEMKHRRNAEASRVVESAITKVLEQDPDLLQIIKRQNRPLLVLIDELGTCPNLLCALCAIHQELGAKLCKNLSGPSCRFVAAGTGINADPFQVGSESRTFAVCFMPTNLRVWQALAVKLCQLGSFLPKFISFLNDNASAKKLFQNPRLAALAFVWSKTRTSFHPLMGSDPSTRAMEALLPIFLGELVMQFRMKNAMRDVDVQDLPKWRRLALAAVLFPHLQLEKNPKYEKDVRALVTSKGVLVDRARDKDTPVPRFWMSPAQAEMFRVGYGYCPVTNSCTAGRGFEITNFLEALLIASQGLASLEDFMNKLGYRGQALPSSAMHFRGVQVVQSNIRVDPARVALLQPKSAWFEALRPIAESSAVVLLNAPKSSFADIIVLIPKVAVVLVQVKGHQVANILERLLQSELGKGTEEHLKTAGAAERLKTAEVTKTDVELLHQTLGQLVGTIKEASSQTAVPFYVSMPTDKAVGSLPPESARTFFSQSNCEPRDQPDEKPIAVVSVSSWRKSE